MCRASLSGCANPVCVSAWCWRPVQGPKPLGGVVNIAHRCALHSERCQPLFCRRRSARRANIGSIIKLSTMGPRADNRKQENVFQRQGRLLVEGAKSKCLELKFPTLIQIYSAPKTLTSKIIQASVGFFRLAALLPKQLVPCQTKNFDVCRSHVIGVFLILRSFAAPSPCCPFVPDNRLMQFSADIIE